MFPAPERLMETHPYQEINDENHPRGVTSRVYSSPPFEYLPWAGRGISLMRVMAKSPLFIHRSSEDTHLGEDPFAISCCLLFYKYCIFRVMGREGITIQ